MLQVKRKVWLLMTAREIVEKIQKTCGVSLPEKTVDRFLAGDPETEVTGIATTFMATAEVVRKAAAEGCNFIITHEPIFYTSGDCADWQDTNPMILKKKRLIEECHMTIWRMHDTMHALKPDMIYTGMLEKLGWEEYIHEGDQRLLDVPEMTVSEIAEHIKHSLSIEQMRFVGDANLSCKRVGFLLGAYSLCLAVGPGMEESISMWMEANQVDLLLAGEMLEWTSCAYIRDAEALGEKHALLVLGHNRSEEAGMEYLAKWLGGLIPGEDICFIESGDTWKYL